MPVNIYRYTDAGAPTMNGSVGELIKVLRACLVDGYGSKAPAGWSMPFTDGQTPPQRAIFRQAPRTDWPQCDFQVDDNITSTVNAYYGARIFGWETATGLDAGSGRFPATAGQAVFHGKSNSTTASRPWLVAATNRACVLYTAQVAGGTGYTENYLSFFGDAITLVPGDVWAVMLAGTREDNPSGRHSLVSEYLVDEYDRNAAVRSYDGTPGGVLLSKRSEGRFWPVADGVGRGDLPYPNADGKAYLTRWMMRQAGHIRLVVPGIWIPMHNWVASSNIAHGDTFTGSGALAGRSFEVWKLGYYAFAVETSDTWYL